MRLGPFRDWRPEPGRILVFLPAADATSRPLPGEPSFLQADHLGAFAALRAAGGRSRAWTGTVTEMPGDLDEAALAAALAAFVSRHEGLRTWFDFGAADGSVERMIADVPPFVAREVSPPADWDAEWYDAIVALYDEACTPDSWPGFVLGAIVRAGSWSLFWGADHAFTDGASQLMAPVELALAYAARTGGEPVALPPAAGFPGYADAERAHAATFTPASAEVSVWRDVVVRHEGRMPALPLPLGLAPGETAPDAIRGYELLDGDGCAALERLCRAAGARFTSGVYAALGLVERELGGAQRYWGVTVLGTRDESTATSHGWFCNFAPVEFPIRAGMAETIPAAEHALQVAKQVAAMPVHAALGVLLAEEATTPDQLYNPHMVSYLDLRRFPGSDLPAYRNALHFTGEGRTANSALWINRDHDGLSVVIRVPDTPAARASADLYALTLRRLLAEATAQPAGPAAP
ncbi:condensation domain-containing protein [Microbacterium sp. NPDC096154]|uniref:condensation domain-containing protein n=1 Tax=Microbacterium sp. NPDC096154 TaxID=3155549 RepID=UPI0033291101